MTNKVSETRQSGPSSQAVHTYRLQDHLRIILAIAAKDILEAIKNKNTIIVMISSLFVVMMYWSLPLLEAGQEPTWLLIYDAGDSSLVPLLENQGTYRIRTYDTEEQMLRRLAAGDRPELGLLIPADFDRTLEAGGTPQLQGYLMNWISAKQAQTLEQAFGAEIQALYGRSIPLQTQGNVIYMRPDIRGAGVQAAMSISFLLIMIGVTLIAHLMMEEKQTKTIQAILISPADASHLVAGKALAGLFYCLLGGAIALAINANLVVHWGYALLAVVVFSLFSVSLGLCLGTFIENRAQMTLWAWVLMMPLIAPMLIVLLDELVPDGIVKIARLTPTAILLEQLQAAFSGSFPLGMGLLQLSSILLWTAAALLVVAWLVRRSDREAPLRLIPHRGQAIQQLAPAGPAVDYIERQAVISSPVSEWVIQPAQPDIDQIAKRVPGWKIIAILAWKDIREAFQNKLVLSILVGVAIMMFSSLALPFLLSLRDTPTAVIYDQGHSTIAAALSGRDELRLRGADSLDRMRDSLTSLSTPMLGLVLPPDFDQLAGSTETIQLQGYVAHWTSPEDASRLAAFFSDQLSRASWGTVEITISDQRVYPSMEGPLMFGLVQIVSILAIGVALVPFLFVEEKESHTLDALLISPVGIHQIVVGKTLAGLFFCTLAGAVILAFNTYSIAHWGIALLAAFLSGLFAVVIGLLVGAFSENPTTVGLRGGLLLLVLLALVMGSLFSQVGWPQWIQWILDWSPVTLMTRLFGLAAVEAPSFWLLASTTAALVAMIGLVMSIVVWRMQRMDR